MTDRDKEFYREEIQGDRINVSLPRFLMGNLAQHYVKWWIPSSAINKSKKLTHKQKKDLIRIQDDYLMWIVGLVRTIESSATSKNSIGIDEDNVEKSMSLMTQRLEEIKNHVLEVTKDADLEILLDLNDLVVE